jgi:hypothetical protein
MIGLGDDNILAVDTPKSDLARLMSSIEDTIKSLGLIPKLKTTPTPSYCSGEFIPLNRKNTLKQQYVLVPCILRQLCKLGFTIADVKNETALQMLKGNFLGNPLVKFVPILRVLYKYYTKLNVNAIFSTEFRVHSSSNVKFTQSYETLDWYYDRYGTTSNDIHAIESYLNSILAKHGNGPFMWDHPVLDSLFKTYN